MEQFSLDTWLQDKSRKVVTRDGRKVNILKYDAITPMYPVIVSIIREDGVEIPSTYTKEGHDNVECLMHNEKNDLFFADEEGELTEFEKALLAAFDCVAAKAVMTINQPISFQEDVKEWSKELLNLARKEIEKDIEHSAVEFAKSYMDDVNPSFEKVKESEELWKWKMSCLRGINNAYKQGKQDALKDLPKWRKNPSREKETMYGMSAISDIYYNGYFIHLDDIYKALPKED